METKYIPGDLVWHYLPKTDLKKYAKVFIVSSNLVLSLEGNDGRQYDRPYSDIYPIPLTPEILEKNGWEEKIGGEKIYWCKDNLLLGRFIKDKFARLRFYYNKECTRLEITYVHQLQHLLFGLGLDSNMII